MMHPLNFLGRRLARFLSKPHPQGVQVSTSLPDALAATLRRGDVLLVEGNTRFSVAIKYLTQSCWSHSALYVGNSFGVPADGNEPLVLLEADINEGVRGVPLSNYTALHTRICRPVGLSPAEIDEMINHAMSRIGQQYDLKNLFDLLRYLLRTPPVPTKWRRRLLAFGSGDPTKAICSSLIAEAFQGVHYPILPEITLERSVDPQGIAAYKEAVHIRHHSLFMPRDFDVSPYFDIVKPTIEMGFDPHRVAEQWMVPWDEAAV